MFKLTRAAARQIRDSARNGDAEELALRIQASRKADGAIEYRMGFDEVGVHDVLLSCQGVDVVFAGSQKELLTGSVLDYVEYESGEHRFVFLNPNDPHFRQPSED